MSRTLVLLFHPNLSRSRANAALAVAVAALPDVEVIDMQVAYPAGNIDTETEVRRLLSAERIILQFPIQWYSTPALLKAWQDSVLTRMFYIAYEAEGRFLEGRPLLVAATAGNVPAAYSPGGVNLFPLAELLKPLRATASRCGLPWAPPFLLHGANRLEPEALAQVGRQYAAHVRQWCAETGRDPQFASRGIEA